MIRLPLLDGTGTNAAGTDGHRFMAAVNHGIHFLKIRIPNLLAFVVRMADMVANLGLLAADITYARHCSLPVVPSSRNVSGNNIVINVKTAGTAALAWLPSNAEYAAHPYPRGMVAWPYNERHRLRRQEADGIATPPSVFKG